jgi:hypothetical protein
MSQRQSFGAEFIQRHVNMRWSIVRCVAPTYLLPNLFCLIAKICVNNGPGISNSLALPRKHLANRARTISETFVDCILALSSSRLWIVSSLLALSYSQNIASLFLECHMSARNRDIPTRMRGGGEVILSRQPVSRSPHLGLLCQSY